MSPLHPAPNLPLRPARKAVFEGRVRWLVVALVVAALSAGGVALAAYGSPADEGSPGVDATVTLTVRYSKFSPAEVRVAPGTTVRFVVENLDPIGHELIIGDSGVHQRHATGTEAHHGDRPGEVSVAADSTAETTFTFGRQVGPMDFGCHLPGHWSYGMHGVLTVA